MELNDPVEQSDTQQQEVLLELYRQRYEHVRHLQQMRATYFNYYLTVIGFSVAATATVYVQFQSLPREATAVIGGLIWLISIFTMMRSERWGGHISHDICTIRRLNNVFSSRFRLVNSILPLNTTPIVSLEFDRPLWDRNRSIETPASILTAILISFLIAWVLSDELWARTLIAAALVPLPVLLWRAEVSNLKRRHAKCCLC